MFDLGDDVEETFEESHFGQLKNRSCGALNTRATFLGTNQPYHLYF